MNKDVGYRNTLTCINKDQIRNIGRYFYEIKHKLIKGTKVDVNTMT
jgi:hypothetical protein